MKLWGTSITSLKSRNLLRPRKLRHLAVTWADIVCVGWEFYGRSLFGRCFCVTASRRYFIDSLYPGTKEERVGCSTTSFPRSQDCSGRPYHPLDFWTANTMAWLSILFCISRTQKDLEAFGLVPSAVADPPDGFSKTLGRGKSICVVRQKWA